MKYLDITDLRVERSDTFHLAIPQLAVQRGTLLAVTGPNGSGKTTLLECIASLLRPNEGTIRVCGRLVSEDLRATKAILGYIPDDETWLIPELCAQEYFELLVGIYKEAGVLSDLHERIQGLARRLNFTAFTQQLGTLSHGNKKKFQIIAGTMHQPKVLIVDELRNGLDPLATIAAEDILRDMVDRGSCIIAATHDLWWAERMAQSILLLADGKPAVHNNTAELVKTHGSLEALFIKLMQTSKHHDD